MPQEQEEIVYSDTQGERLDVFISKKFGFSRSFFANLLENWFVLVNQQNKKKSYKLKPNDKILVKNFSKIFSKDILDEASYKELDVLIDKKDYLVVNKPKGVVSHPTSVWDMWTPSVASFVYHKYNDIPLVDDVTRPGIVHRLDKETSWPMIVAKTYKGYDYFKNLFKKKSNEYYSGENSSFLKKFYEAEVLLDSKCSGVFIQEKLPFFIEEDVVPRTPCSYVKKWVTKVNNVLNLYDNVFKIQMELITGRTHQARYHLSNNWAYILGDYLYWNKTSVSLSSELKLKCNKLEFQDLYGECITLEV